MNLRCHPTTRLLVGIFVAALLFQSSSEIAAQDQDLKKLEGEWLFVEGRTEGRPKEEDGAPMSVKFSLQVKEDAVIYPRPRGDERITLDGSIIEKKDDNGSLKRYSGQWKDGALTYTLVTIRLSDNKQLLKIQRVFRATDEGLLVTVIHDSGNILKALYQHPENIKLPKPAKASVADVAWLHGAWTGKRYTSSVEEQWSPPKGGAMLGFSRSVRKDRMVGFEFLRIVERDGGLVYFAQPGGRPPTEFVLTKLTKNRAEFVNPRHDYPQRIVYELSENGSLFASIGFAIGRLQSLEYKREAE